MLKISQEFTKKFSKVMMFNINYESINKIYKIAFKNAKNCPDKLERIQLYDNIWSSLENLNNYFLN